MKYDPKIHHRKSLRLKGYDYSQDGLYFITMCCQNRIHRFGMIENRQMILNEYGQIAYDEWIKLAERFSTFELDTFQIMPDHMHGIILLNTVGAEFTPAPNKGTTVKVVPTEVIPTEVVPSISDIVGAYKSLVSNGCLNLYKMKNKVMGKLWQRNYYEHIIRNEIAYRNISNYIINNPAKWDEDNSN